MKIINSDKIKEIFAGKGALEILPEKCREYFENGNAYIVTDSNVAPLWLDKIKARLDENGLNCFEYVIPAGEKSKTKDTLFDILDDMQKNAMGRKDYVIALGGGVTGDIAGLAASLYNRGIPVVQIPTSLLAMVDSSIGGKTAINTNYGKNLIGTFHQPTFVICDSDFLSTLPENEFTNGMAEVIKYGVIADKELFDSLLTGVSRDDMDSVIERCIKIKTDIVDKDEKDKDARLILNFGHTYGHAIELLSEYTIPHGYAVAKGMVLAALKSEKEGLCQKGTAEKIAHCCKVNSLDTSCEYTEAQLLEAAALDKKRDSKGVKFVLLR